MTTHYKYYLPAPEVDITKTSVWKTRRPGLSGPVFDVLSAQNAVIAKQNQEILRLMSSKDYGKREWPAKVVGDLLLNENARELLLRLSRDFVEQKNGRMFGKKTETAKNMGAPAWKVFVLDSLKGEEEPEAVCEELIELIEEMPHPTLVDVFVKLSKVLIEAQKLEPASTTTKSKRKGSIDEEVETTGPRHKTKPGDIEKDGKLFLNRVKPEETLVEARSGSDMQIDGQQRWKIAMTHTTAGLDESRRMFTLTNRFCSMIASSTGDGVVMLCLILMGRGCLGIGRCLFGDLGKRMG